MDYTKLYIHIGLHKTATSSFQYLLQNVDNSKFMLKHKINFIRNLNSIKKNHINILSKEGWIMPYFNKTFQGNNEKIWKGKKLISNIDLKHSEIETYKKSINYKLDVSVICVLREQSSYIESFYLQQVKTKQINLNFNDFKKTSTRCKKYYVW